MSFSFSSLSSPSSVSHSNFTSTPLFGPSSSFLFVSPSKPSSLRLFSTSSSSSSSSSPPEGLTHISKANAPQMVDVSEKKDTLRTAHARTVVDLPVCIKKILDEKSSELQSPKGPVFATAIVAGTSGVKLTSLLIPFCHPLPVLDCKFSLRLVSDVTDSPLGDDFGVRVEVDCRVKVSGKTGVEMEALTGCSVCALTIYDMCKAMSHHIVIGPTRLLEKKGGKSDLDLREDKVKE